MWSLNDPARRPSAPQQVVPESILYEFDGPLIFTAVLGFSTLLFTKIDQKQSTELYLAVPIEEAVLAAVEAGTLALEGVYERTTCLIVETDTGLQVSRYWQSLLDEIPSRYRPQGNAGIDSDAEWVASSFEQIGAFFSVRFSGASLRHNVMPFSVFKKLVDTTYDSARRIFVPDTLRSSKSSTLDFDIREPAFGSLVIALDKPKLNERNIRKHLRSDNVDVGGIEQNISEKRSDFFSELHSLVRTAEDGQVSVAEAEAHYGILDQVSELIPDERTRFDRVEFNALVGNVQHHLAVEEDVGSVLRTALRQIEGRVRTITGEVRIVNANSSKFTVLPDGGHRQVTCQATRTEFDILRQDPRFRDGARVVVEGNFYRRSVRDYLALVSPVRFV